MSATRVFVARLTGCGVFDPQGDRVGKVIDVLMAYRATQPPRATGFIIEISGRRRVFLPVARVTAIAPGQLMSNGFIDLRRFSQRGQEVRAIAQMLGRKVTLLDGSGIATIEDFSIEKTKRGDWVLAELFVRKAKNSALPFAKGSTLFVNWNDASENHENSADQDARQLLSTVADLRPADLATAMLELPEDRMIALAEGLDDERLADLLEELPEEEQLEIMKGLDDDRAAEVLDLMGPDDAADLMANLSAERTETLLDLMDPEEAEDIRSLLKYGPYTAGGMMTPEPIICAADTTVAEAMALIRRKEVESVLAAQVFVTLPPYETPAGKYLGVVHFQKLLRYPPHQSLSSLLDTEQQAIGVNTPIAQIHRDLAAYDLIALPVVDERNHLLGVVTVDDVLDHLLPQDWRSEEE
ncbi:magnesium transporter MgtE N-terminal domain-containing protein [Candidatus Aquiluna sp. UB-MaderosW2red]|jgi:CBS domain-containing protein/sporulation protein YlmC with PRC-barrel domain|uniref:magnesium transporter MgtE N-terminal domain-containing protein n=1 Tax=Candidatus Aquiluna sp. UB-MaderosW2red TaxID=1855377 RepID=UPI000875ABD6|nr:CBS domain-containing protein [Candidatus Aquiluna sp. UB-MaderosW2red]SCX14107.1 CBS domain-containing protein [Candidatus Aquiluna sp. UB-MaderosW2red]